MEREKAFVPSGSILSPLERIHSNRLRFGGTTFGVRDLLPQRLLVEWSSTRFARPSQGRMPQRKNPLLESGMQRSASAERDGEASRSLSSFGHQQICDHPQRGREKVSNTQSHADETRKQLLHQTPSGAYIYIPAHFDNEGNYFIDRNGQLFFYFLEWMRTGVLSLPPNIPVDTFLIEATFYQVKIPIPPPKAPAYRLVSICKSDQWNRKANKKGKEIVAVLNEQAQDGFHPTKETISWLRQHRVLSAADDSEEMALFVRQ